MAFDVRPDGVKPVALEHAALERRLHRRVRNVVFAHLRGDFRVADAVQRKVADKSVKIGAFGGAAAPLHEDVARAREKQGGALFVHGVPAAVDGIVPERMKVEQGIRAVQSEREAVGKGKDFRIAIACEAFFHVLAERAVCIDGRHFFSPFTHPLYSISRGKSS